MDRSLKPHLIEFRQILDLRGALTPINSGLDVPFEIKRVYFIYDVSAGAGRAGHSHKQLEQILIAVSGSFKVHLDNSYEKQTFYLNRPNVGLYVPRMYWRDIDDFSSNSICLALASDHYDEADYYRDYDDFVRALG